MLAMNQRGYAVMNRELDAYAFEHEDLERCKRYCHNGDVIVEMIPYVNGINIRIRIFPRTGKFFGYEKYNRQVHIGKLHIQFEKLYWHKTGEIVYDSLNQSK